MKLYEEAANLNYAIAQYNLAMMYEKFEINEALLKKHLNCMKKLPIKILYQHKIIQRDYTILAWERQKIQKKLFWYEKAAQANNDVAQFNVALMFYSGEGTSKDYDKTLYWLEESANAGNKFAQTQLGDFYRTGELVTQSYEEAFFGILKQQPVIMEKHNTMLDCFIMKDMGQNKIKKKDSFGC